MDDEPRGIMCPKCECRDVRVIETRKSIMKRTRRRRVCRHCGFRFTTYEQIEEDD